MVIDFHTHIFPDRLADRAVGQLARESGYPHYTDGTADSLRASMERGGVTHSVVLNIAVRPGQADSVNQFARQLLREQGQGRTPCLIPFAALHPFDADWRERLRKIKEDGFVGVKLHPDYQGYYIDDARLEPVYRELAALDLVTVFHAGFDIAYPQDIHATPRRIDNVLPLLEKGKTVLAHFGAAHLYQGTLELLCGRNVYFDTAHDLMHMPVETARQIIRKHGPERMLFATDSPWADQGAMINKLKNEVARDFLSRADLEGILGGNAAQLLGLSQ